MRTWEYHNINTWANGTDKCHKESGRREFNQNCCDETSNWSLIILFQLWFKESICASDPPCLWLDPSCRLHAKLKLKLCFSLVQLTLYSAELREKRGKRKERKNKRENNPKKQEYKNNWKQISLWIHQPVLYNDTCEHHSTVLDGYNKQIQTPATLKISNHNQQNLPSSHLVNPSEVWHCSKSLSLWLLICNCRYGL